MCSAPSKVYIIVFMVLFRSSVWGDVENLLTRNELLLDLDHIQSNTSLDIQLQSARDVINRILPNHSHLFDTEIFTKPTRSFQIVKNESNILIRGTDGISICKGFYHYLKYYLNCSISWSGAQLENIPDELPSIDITVDSPAKFIYYQNVCTWGYSFTWWTWDNWRRHIDWMALMGISLTIAPIQEAIWSKIYKNMGMTQYEIDDHISGPAFLPWQRMGNIRGWGGPMPRELLNEQLTLQKRIIEAQRNLGMTVAIPGFSGHVPIAIRRIYPNITLTSVDCWNRFERQYCCPLFIDPIEQLFHDIGEKFLTEVIREYGTDHLYFSDPFNEIQPRKADANYLAQTSLNIHKAMESVDPNAIWLLQGWMFVKNPFWSDSLLKAFLTAVPQGKMIILDLQSELFPQYDRTSSYFGQPFIWCMLHNFGGTLGMHGSIDIVNKRIEYAWNMDNSTMIGVGITPEGINQNYAMYEFALDKGWIINSIDSINVDEWFVKYSRARYGVENYGLERSWKIIRDTVYSYQNLIKLHGKYTIARRPGLKLAPWVWYDPLKFKEAWTLLLFGNTSLYNNTHYQHDVVDFTRQFLQLAGDSIYIKILAAFKDKNQALMSNLGDRMIQVFIDLERILRTHEDFMLGPWLEAAKGMGKSELEKEVFEMNARNQITIWGPNGEIVDYATKQWSGIAQDFFMERWCLFINGLKESLKMKRKFNETQFKLKVFREIEHPFVIAKKIYPVEEDGDSVKVALDIHKYWTKQISCGNLQLQNIPIREGDGCKFLSNATDML